MIELNEDRICSLRDAITEDQIFARGITCEAGIQLWKEFVSSPIGEYNGSLLHTMEGFDVLCDKAFGPKVWELQVRNKVDVENFFSQILCIVKESYFKQLRPEEKKDLKVLYTALGLPIDDTEWSGEELEEISKRNWLTDKKEAYRLIYKLYYAVLTGKVAKENISKGRYVDMVDCLLSTYIDCVAQYQPEIQKAYERMDVKVNWLDYCNNILTDKRRKKDMEEYVMVNWKEEAHTVVSTEELPDDVAVVTLCGGAGVGKSTALLYLQYKACEKYVSGDKSVKIPVLIRLKNVSERGERKSISKLLCEELKIEEVVLSEVLRKEPIRLFFDGFNEVPVENHEQESVKCEINDLINEYGVPIIVTDRTGETGIEPADYRCICRKYKLVNLDETQVREYFKRKTNENQYARERIEAELTGNLSWVLTEPVTPYQLEVIVGLAVRNEEFGERDVLMQRHLKELFKRELRQRDRFEVYNLRAWLREISKEMANTGRRSISKKVISTLLNNQDYKPYFIWASELMILYSDGDSVRFVAEEEYCNFFLNYVTDEGTENTQGYI